MKFDNVYEDSQRAEAYSRLEFPGTYHLAFRDLPEIIAEHVRGRNALDFGCGTGRSTRFLKKHGFNAIGVDISDDMLKLARERDGDGDYHLVKDSDLGQFGNDSFDLVQSVFTFDNIPTEKSKIRNLSEIKRMLLPNGIVINLVSSPDIYLHEWASFSTRDFPENHQAKSGDPVRIIMKDVEDQRPVIDILWDNPAYQTIYDQVGLEIVRIHKPLARTSEPYPWVNETQIAPWVIYVLKKA